MNKNSPTPLQGLNKFNLPWYQNNSTYTTSIKYPLPKNIWQAIYNTTAINLCMWCYNKNIIYNMQVSSSLCL